MSALKTEYLKLTKLICLWKLNLYNLEKVEDMIISIMDNNKENEIINQLLYELDATSISNYFTLIGEEYTNEMVEYFSSLALAEILLQDNIGFYEGIEKITNIQETTSSNYIKNLLDNFSIFSIELSDYEDEEVLSFYGKKTTNSMIKSVKNKLLNECEILVNNHKV